MAWLSSSQNARSSSPGTMPRSRQISAMTAPTGRRRTSAAIFLLRGQVRETRVLGGVGGLGLGLGVRRHDLPCGAWPACGGHADRRRREIPAACGALAKPGFEGRGATQAIGDAGEDGREIAGAEGSREQGEAWGVSALLHRAGELLAVVDQFADQAEDAAEGGGDGRVVPGRIGMIRGWRGGLAAADMNERRT